jgi:hexosaminidase
VSKTFLFFIVGAVAALGADIVPLPVECRETGEVFVPTKETPVVSVPAGLDVAGFVREEWRRITGAAEMEGDAGPTKGGGIFLKLDPSLKELGGEGYELKTGKDGVEMKAPTEAGLFYAWQTLKQLMPPEVYAAHPPAMRDWRIDGVKIRDLPRFEWRGLMVDISRHFFGREELKRVIDWMAMHKLNRLHLHLTDNDAWRLEIARYPELTEKGSTGCHCIFSRKNKAHRSQMIPSKPGGCPSGYETKPGYLTKEDVRDLVAYAALRYVVVIPEIDVPGHSAAINRVFPELGDGKDTLNIGKRETYQFLENVFAEVAETFPGPYIHLGGDEVRKGPWMDLPEVKTMMREKGFKTPKELQEHFARHFVDFIKSKGKIPVGWDDISDGGVDKTAVLDWWRSRNPEVRDRAVKEGYKVVICPSRFVYFDYPYEKGARGAFWEGIRNGPNTSKLIYGWHPVPAKYSAEENARVLGLQANVWTEFIETPPRLEFMLFPRLSAFAERAWSPGEARDYPGFESRMKTQVKRYDALGVSRYVKSGASKSERP